MDIKGFPALIVGVVVALVLAGATLPIWADTLATEDTFKNDGLFYMDKIDADTEIIGEWDPTDPTNITINDNVIALPQSSTFPLTLIAYDDWGLRYLGTMSGGAPSVTLFDDAYSTRLTVSTESTDPFTIAISGGTASFSDGVDTVEKTFTEGFIISNTGPYVMKKGNTDAYLNGDSIIYSTGRSGGLSSLTSNTVSIHLDGTIDDGVNVNMVYPGNYTTSNISVNATEINGYKDLYAFTSVTFTVADTSEHTANATYSQVIVPYEITAERAVSMSGPLGVLVGVLPLLIVAGLVTGAVVWFINRKG